MAEEPKEVDYRAELKAVLDSFEKAAASGNQAARDLRDGVARLARLTRTALQGTQFEKQAPLLALEMARAGMTPETLHNAPLKIQRTGGADVYKVVKVLQKAAKEEVGKSEAEAAPEAKEEKSGRK